MCGKVTDGWKFNLFSSRSILRFKCQHSFQHPKSKGIYIRKLLRERNWLLLTHATQVSPSFLIPYLLIYCQSHISNKIKDTNLLEGMENEQQTLAMASGEGVPRKSVMRSNWWTTFFPGKRGFPVKSSAKMQPMLHMSIAGVYWKKRIL